MSQERTSKEAELDAALAVIKAAAALREIDSPFLREVCSNLFESIAAYERAKLRK